ncbi:MAG TPA: LPS export ABC transporter periplasmic protein LptC [Candidatus Kapabacteria bacterium]|nr:LPS export ABC transporter periplasmic protein LptC [Candidatus Kapabacteria bacterium]HPO62633.1 LPS export ABC transporter periplasmic protein LptC [Candidatus Kapabacteria bacterium]
MKKIIFITNYFKVLIFLIILISLISCNEEKAVPQKIIEDIGMIQPDIISTNITVSFVDSSYTKAVLKADRAKVFNERKKTYLEGNVKADFFSQKTKQRVSWLTSDSAEVDDNTKDMLAKGNVVVVSDSNNTRLETTILHWDNKTQKLYSTEFVNITSPQENIKGWGFESDINLSNYRIFKVSGSRK